MRSSPRRALLATVATASLLGAGLFTPDPVGAVGGDRDQYTATPLGAGSRTTGAKSSTGKLAQTDPSLLGRTDGETVAVIVKLDYDAAATYAGDIVGLDATSPRVTGLELTGDTPAEVAYEGYTAAIDAQFRADVASAVPSAELGRSFTTVYGGVAMKIPANAVGTVLSLPNVAAVQLDELRSLQTDSSTEFIGAPTLWEQDGGQALAGAGVVFGDLDTGVWPEHPSFADPGLAEPPPTTDGEPLECDFGDNPVTPAEDPFECNNKLIGGRAFLDAYNAIVGGEVYGDSARDSNGHGTHTTTTAAGSVVDSAEVLGVDRGRVSGVAPGAWVIAYKVCGVAGCFSSDSAAAVERAILDGVDVINYSISGGTNPFTDPVELAFLDAYNAGVTVAASGGNEGPGAATVNHFSPWTITVAASTQTREFESTLTLTADGGASTVLTGASITAGAGPAPVVLASAPPYSDPLCTTEAPPGTFAGQIVACERGVNARVEKGYNVLQGGAVGMILYNPTLQEVVTDNHWLPTVHLADGTDFLAFMADNTGVVAEFTAGEAAEGQGDVMAAFSSRGPGGLFLKPDITAPGVQILAGHTPTPESVVEGPPLQLFQAIAGTSMSAPHIAGSAILLQSVHPDWGPGAIKSALMTTATTDVVKEDLTTPADPFDMGAGRVDLTVAGSAPIVFEDSGVRMAALGSNPVTAMDVNIPSVNIPTMPGAVHTVRTARNVSGRPYRFDVTTIAPEGSKIRVVPSRGVIAPGESKSFDIYIKSSAEEGQYFGEIRFTSHGNTPLHLPVAFFNQQGSVTLTQTCSPNTVRLRRSTTCTVTAQNDDFAEATVRTVTDVGGGLKIVRADGATVRRSGRFATAGPVTLAGQTDAMPALSALGFEGYLSLPDSGISAIPIGDEESIDFDVPAYVFGGREYTSIGITSNGYALVGGTEGAADINCCAITDFPDAAAPNGVLAPFWTDLDGTAAPGIYVAGFTDEISGESWLAVEWQLHDFGTDTLRTFQLWIGINGVEDVSYSYDQSTFAAAPVGQDFLVGVENESGTAGDSLGLNVLPTEDLRVTTTPGEPGGSLTYTVQVRGTATGFHRVRTHMRADIVPGVTIVRSYINVLRR